MSSALQVQKLSWHRCVAPQAIVDDASWTCYAVDTNGCKAIHCLVHLGATDIAMVALKIQEAEALSSATALNSGADITGATFTAPTDTADNTFLLCTIPVTGARMRYFNLVATAGDGSTGTYLTAIWIKESKDEAPGTAALRNLGQHLIVAG